MASGQDKLDGGTDASREAKDPSSRDRAGGWTIVLVAIGLGLIACCFLIPQADENRRLAHQREQLRIDLEHLQKQVQVNDEFLRRLGNDPALAERLAQRQMRLVRKGTGVLDVDGESDEVTSPFLLTTVPPPNPLPEYEPQGGKLARWCRDTHTRLYMIGSGLMLLALGLVLGYTPRAE